MNAPDSRTPRRNLARLTPTLDKQLLAYATAATAAGIGLLAQPAEAKIVYTAANTTIQGNGGNLNLDLNNDGIADFTIFNGFPEGVRHPEGAFGYGLISIRRKRATKFGECAAALPPSVKVGPGAAFQSRSIALFLASGSYTR
jgi:hypothetical protein